jgi:hypothetical protein
MRLVVPAADDESSFFRLQFSRRSRVQLGEGSDLALAFYHPSLTLIAAAAASPIIFWRFTFGCVSHP